MTNGWPYSEQRASAAASVGVDPHTMRRLLLHEARVHALPGRTLQDMSDAILLTDPVDPEPFWNRLEAIHWPSEPEAFDRRLDEAVVMFATLARRPHVWPSPAYDEPADLVARLLRNGFEDVGGGHLMVLIDPAPARAAAIEMTPPDVTIERLHRLEGDVEELARSITGVLADAFEVDPLRAQLLQTETAAALRNPSISHYLARMSGAPVALARAATFDGCTYLSSIGTVGGMRGRGLGRLVTARAVADALTGGSEWIHLGVFVENDGARRLYERLGFVSIGGPVPDLLLIG
ncbi:MAG: GNAT family N-acetyltransferase [Chloroflexota bacterium]